MRAADKGVNRRDAAARARGLHDWRRMKRMVEAMVAALALAALPSLARADEPAMPGRVTGMSELPDRVQDGVRREAERAGEEIGPLRRAPDGSYRAELTRGGHGEVVTLGRDGSVRSRQVF
jgi:hypothetical protein